MDYRKAFMRQYGILVAAGFLLMSLVIFWRADTGSQAGLAILLGLALTGITIRPLYGNRQLKWWLHSVASIALLCGIETIVGDTVMVMSFLVVGRYSFAVSRSRAFFYSFLSAVVLSITKYVNGQTDYPALLMMAGAMIFLSLIIQYTSFFINDLNRFSLVYSMFYRTKSTVVQVIDRQGRLLFINEGITPLIGKTPQELVGTYDFDIFYGGEKYNEDGQLNSIMMRSLEEQKDYHEVLQKSVLPNGETHVYLGEILLHRGPDGEIQGAVGVFRDVTDREQANQQLQATNTELVSLVYTDPLTKLWNHLSFHHTLDEWLSDYQLNRQSFAVMYVNVDRFKAYNEIFSYEEGDRLLIEVSNVIRMLMPKESMIARYQGDQFAILFPVHEPEQAHHLGERVRSHIESMSENGMVASEVTVSVGIAVYPDHASKKEDLIHAVEEALMRAKRRKGNTVEVYYSILDDLKKELKETEFDLVNTMKTLITLINAKDQYTYGHSERVMSYTVDIAKKMGLPDERVKMLGYAAYLHDIGKIEMDREILIKIGKLTDEEWKIIKQHPVWGADIIRPISALEAAVPGVLHHHERWDGKGYPAGLSGYDIPLDARIIAVADSFDAMTTHRPYASVRTYAEAREELIQSKGVHFDMEVVDVFLPIIDQLIREEYSLLDRIS